MTETDTETDKIGFNTIDIGQCIGLGLCLCAVWTPPHNPILLIFICLSRGLCQCEHTLLTIIITFLWIDRLRFAQKVLLGNAPKRTCILLVCLVPSPRRHLDSMIVSGLLCCKCGKKLTKVIIILLMKKIFLYNQKFVNRGSTDKKISYSAMFAPFHDNTAQTYVRIYVYKIMASDRRFGAWNKASQNKVHQLISTTPPI